uniref:Uncharacterized protein n=1 Tax=Anguilla anguilla TaxID=7936 RepID=A0A0E9RZ05_ANGAN
MTNNTHPYKQLPLKTATFWWLGSLQQSPLNLLVIYNRASSWFRE